MTSAAQHGVHPWNAAIWQRSVESIDRLPQGLLVAGPQGMGKRQFALALARVEMCSVSTEQACGECQTCTLFESGNLPDLHLVMSEVYADALDGTAALTAGRYLPDRKDRNPRPIITVDQIRQLIERMSTTAHIAKTRVVIIAPAEAMNVNASNALLKLLEEPPDNTRMILLTSAPGRLLPTIRSRTSHIELRPPAHEPAMAWLKKQAVSSDAAGMLRMAGGAPLEALRLHQSGEFERRQALAADLAAVVAGKQSPMAAADQWKSTGVKPVLDALLSIMDDWLRAAHVSGECAELQGAIHGLDLRKAHIAREELAQASARWDTSLDATLVLEQAFLSVTGVRQQ